MAIRSKRRHKIRRVVAQVCNDPWLIRTDKALQIQEFLNLRGGGYELSRSEINEAFGMSGDRPRPIVLNGIAVLPLRGVIAPRVNMLTSFSGGTTCDVFAMWFRAALANQAVRAIVLDVDSPGGQVRGVEELAEEIFQARAQKPLIAVANYECMSAAYWLASAAGELVASPSSEVGSIGVVRIHQETSKADELAGRTTTIMRIPEFKIEANPFEPLSADAKAHFEGLNKNTYDKFTAALARNRGVSSETAEFGRGRYFQAPEALRLGMVDRLGTLEDVLRELSNPESTGPRSNAGRASASMHPAANKEEPTMWQQIRDGLVARGLCGPEASEADVRRIAGMFMAAHGQQAADDDKAVLALIGTMPTPAQPAAQPPATPAPAAQQPPAPAVAPTPQTGGTAAVQTPPPAPAQPQLSTEQQAALNERQRISDIRARGGLLNIDAEAIDAAINAGTSVEAAVLSFTDQLATRNQPVSTSAVSVDGSPVDRIHEGAIEALALRAMSGSDRYAAAVAQYQQQTFGLAPPPPQPEPSAAARPFLRMSLMQIAAASMSARGWRQSHTLDPELLAVAFLQNSCGQGIQPFAGFGDGSYNTPGQYPNLLSNLAGKMMDMAAPYAGATYPRWTYQLEPVPDFKPRTLIAQGASGELPHHRDGENFDQSDLAEEASWIAVDSFGDEFKMTPMMMVNNELQSWADMAVDKQIAFELTLNRLACDLLNGNPTLVDGTAFFHADHGNLETSGAAPSQTTSDTARQLMRAQQSPGSKRRLRFGPAIALLPIKHETVGETTYLPYNVVPVTDSTINTFRGKVAPVVEPMLDDADADAWYSLADPRLVHTIVVAHQMGFQNGGQRLTYFNPANKCQIFQIEGRMGAAVRNWRGAVKNPGQ